MRQATFYDLPGFETDMLNVKYPDTDTEQHKKTRREIHADYEGFIAKQARNHAKTTDDCYTPPAVYDAVAGWVRDTGAAGKCTDIEGCNILRPFYPGGDYQSEPYGAGDVVIDNPPFSILGSIVRWYNEHAVRYFLFAPGLTCCSIRAKHTNIITGMNIVYNNGALVNTGFVSNMFGDVFLMTAPDLGARIRAAQAEERRPKRNKLQYPANVITAGNCQTVAAKGLEFTIAESEVYRLKNGLENYSLKTGKKPFGGAYLMTDAKAAEFAELRRETHRQTVLTVELSENERGIIKELNDKNKDRYGNTND